MVPVHCATEWHADLKCSWQRTRKRCCQNWPLVLLRLTQAELHIMIGLTLQCQASALVGQYFVCWAVATNLHVRVVAILSYCSVHVEQLWFSCSQSLFTTNGSLTIVSSHWHCFDLVWSWCISLTMEMSYPLVHKLPDFIVFWLWVCGCVSMLMSLVCSQVRQLFS